MDKLTLTTGQLKELKKYIESRGFREPLIVMEILDHFACLVEEKMQADPRLTLAEAMQQAHTGFGVRGFKSLADAADNERNKKFTKVFKTKLRALVFNPLAAITIVLFAIFCYRAYSWVLPFQGGWFNGAYAVSFNFIIIYAVGMIAINRQVPDRAARYNSGYASLANNGYSWIIFVLVMTFPKYPYPAIAVWPFALGASLLTTYLVVHIIAQYRTVVHVVKQNRHIADMYMELSS